jgi:rhodanese-related sulfurtransferase
MSEEPAAPPLEVSPEEAQQWLRSGAPPRLIDCREQDEYALCRLDGSELFPLSQWMERWQEKFGDRDQAILIYCHHGLRSLRAVEYLRAKGFSNVRSLAGGIDLWSRKLDPSIPRY